MIEEIIKKYNKENVDIKISKEEDLNFKLWFGRVIDGILEKDKYEFRYKNDFLEIERSTQEEIIKEALAITYPEDFEGKKLPNRTIIYFIN